MIDERSSHRAADRLRSVITSRRLFIALCALLVGLLVIAIPQLQTIQSELLIVVLSLGLTLFGRARRRDGSKAACSDCDPLPRDPRDMLFEFIMEALDDDEAPEERTPGRRHP